MDFQILPQYSHGLGWWRGIRVLPPPPQLCVRSSASVQFPLFFPFRYFFSVQSVALGGWPSLPRDCPLTNSLSPNPRNSFVTMPMMRRHPKQAKGPSKCFLRFGPIVCVPGSGCSCAGATNNWAIGGPGRRWRWSGTKGREGDKLDRRRRAVAKEGGECLCVRSGAIVMGNLDRFNPLINSLRTH